jgi:hypothetical protein
VASFWHASRPVSTHAYHSTPCRLIGRIRLRLAQTSLRQRYPYTPQTKGKVERTVGLLKSGFWPGVAFTDLDDLNAQALAWCDRLNGQPHTTTRVAPCVRLAEERLRPLPTDWAWERFATEERKVSWDGYVSYDGVLYGLPAHAPGSASPLALAGTTVQVRERGGQVVIWSAGQEVLVAAKRPRSRTLVPHPDQFRGVASAASALRSSTPLGHRVPAPMVARRDLQEYDRLYGVPSVPSGVTGLPAERLAERLAECKESCG